MLLLLALAALLYAILMAGRLAGARKPYRRENFAVATGLSAGLGLYMLWWLALQPLLGAGPWVTALAFGGFTGLLAAGLYREWHDWPREQHHGSHICLVLLLGAPLLGVVWHTPPGGELFWHQASAAAALGRFGAWPPAAALPLGLLPPVPGLLPLLQPLSGLGDIAQPPLVPLLLNLGALLAAGGALLLALNWPLKWSNLPLAAAGSLAAVVLLNPWLPLVQVADPQSVLLPALCLFAAALPLFSPLPLPGGWGALGPALSLTALATLHPLGWPLALWFAVSWKLRALAEGIASPDRARRHLLGLTLLVTLPALAWALWQLALAPFGLGIGPQLLHPWGFLTTLLEQVPAPVPGWPEALALAAVAAALVAALWPLFGRLPSGFRPLFTTHAPLFCPLLLSVPPLLALACFAPAKAFTLLALQQFIWLVPLAWRAGQLYRASGLRNRLFHAPWTYGLLASTALFALLLALSAPPLKPPAPWAGVAAGLAPYKLVLSAGLPPEASAEIAYRSAATTRLLMIPPAQGQAALAIARQHNLPILATAQAAAGLTLSGTLPPLMLFQPDAAGATLLNNWNFKP
jgi:hypothetical protein